MIEEDEFIDENKMKRWGLVMLLVTSWMDKKEPNNEKECSFFLLPSSCPNSTRAYSARHHQFVAGPIW